MDPAENEAPGHPWFPVARVAELHNGVAGPVRRDHFRRLRLSLTMSV
ncbi:hypothetical protein FHS32_004993 [Streptomyces albaduncus]|uniref:Uncharacterized protein n=1 Tax=Streptomyces griseoloalbus TaxID=67303 RepID=A0A7W8BU78_9ACTN|nr:hypothetical protein [Streptomyces albaduncus]MBB5128218.1 hypothetical protein [Streptomyces albaduncus]